MALRGITLRRRPVLPATRASSSSRSPFPPPPPPANDPDAAHSPSFSSLPNPGAPRNPASSHFLDIGDRLRSSPTSPSPRKSPEDIRRMIQNFRSTGGSPSTSFPGVTPSPSAPGATPSFANLFRKDSVAQGPNAGQGVLGHDAIRRGSLKAPWPRTPSVPPSLSNNYSWELERNSKAVGAVHEEKDSAIALKRRYSYEELGKRLGELRPAGAGKDGKEWFSLKELQGRIAKLSELEKQENKNKLTSPHLEELRNIIEKQPKQGKPVRQVNLPSLLFGSQLDYMGRPPQEELLEKYFHPDHMSSEEKMKLELQRVRDEFKMSENDWVCTSSKR